MPSATSAIRIALRAQGPPLERPKNPPVPVLGKDLTSCTSETGWSELMLWTSDTGLVVETGATEGGTDGGETELGGGGANVVGGTGFTVGGDTTVGGVGEMGQATVTLAVWSAITPPFANVADATFVITPQLVEVEVAWTCTMLLLPDARSVGP